MITKPWSEVFIELGIPAKHFTKKHCSCPACGGEDRFRYVDFKGRGTWICSRCGAGGPYDLIEKVLGWSREEAQGKVAKVVGVKRTTESVRRRKNLARRKEVREKRRMEAIRDTILRAESIKSASPAGKYLTRRGFISVPSTEELLQHDGLITDGQRYHGMIALIRDKRRRVLSVHRTFLSPEGEKLNRKIMPLPSEAWKITGCAVRLYEPEDGLVCIAEGIETALAVRWMTGLPVWSGLNANLMAKIEFGDDVRVIEVWGDNDSSFTGQAAAYELARRARTQKVEVKKVRIPEKPDTDWADVHLLRRGGAESCEVRQESR